MLDKTKVDLVRILKGVFSFAFLEGADWQLNVYNMVNFYFFLTLNLGSGNRRIFFIKSACLVPLSIHPKGHPGTETPVGTRAPFTIKSLICEESHVLDILKAEGVMRKYSQRAGEDGREMS